MISLSAASLVRPDQKERNRICKTIGRVCFLYAVAHPCTIHIPCLIIKSNDHAIEVVEEFQKEAQSD
jgi:hypothetical protein